MVQPLAGPPPTNLSQSNLNLRLHPRHASLATQSESKKLLKQATRRQLQQQQRRRLPLTQYDFYNKLSQ